MASSGVSGVEMYAAHPGIAKSGIFDRMEASWSKPLSTVLVSGTQIWCKPCCRFSAKGQRGGACLAYQVRNGSREHQHQCRSSHSIWMTVVALVHCAETGGPHRGTERGGWLPRAGACSHLAGHARYLPASLRVLLTAGLRHIEQHR